MVKKDKQELSAYCQKTIKQLAINKKVKRDMMNGELKDRISINKITELFLLKEDEYVLLNTNEIYWIAKYLSSAKNQSKFEYIFSGVSIDDYFTNTEKSEAEIYVIPTNTDDEDYLILDNVDFISDREYVCSNISYQMIKRLYDSGIIIYSFDQQRESTTVNIGVSYIKKPTVYRKSVEKIKEKMRNNKFYSNMITFNILDIDIENEEDDNKEKFIYKPESRQMVFYKNSQVLLIDGMHRVLSICELLEEIPDLEGHMQLKIWRMDARSANEYIHQETQGNVITEERKRSLQQDRFVTVVKMINTMGNSDTNAMYNKITDNSDELYKFNSKFCFYSHIASVLEDVCGEDILSKPAHNYKVASFLVEFFNEYTVIDTIEDEFERVEASRKYNVATLPNTFMMITYLGIRLYGDRKWRSKLDSFVNSINFRTDNKVWQELLITSVRNDKKIRTKIYNFVNDKIQELENNNDIAVD